MLFWNNQSSRSLIGNSQGQNQSFSGRPFSPETSKTSLCVRFVISLAVGQFPHFNSASSFQSHSVSTGVPIYGTVDYLAKSHTHHIHENQQREQYTCITGTILGCSLEELRIQDHFNLKEKLLPEWKQELVNIILTRNRCKRDNSRTCLLKHSDVFLEPHSFFYEPEPEPKRQFSKGAPMENVVKVQEKLDKQATVSSNPGYFSSEVNKMVLVSSFLSLLQKHKMSLPENLLDDTDFVSQFFVFLERYKVNLPTENIPKFSLSTFTSFTNQSSNPVVQPQTSAAIGKKKTKKAFKRFSSKKSKNEKLCKIKAPEKDVPAEAIDAKHSLIPGESRLNLEKEEEEKGEVRDEKGGVQKDHLNNEDGGKKEEENVVKNLENRDEASKARSVGSSEENSSYEEVISVPKSRQNDKNEVFI